MDTRRVPQGSKMIHVATEWGIYMIHVIHGGVCRGELNWVSTWLPPSEFQRRSEMATSMVFASGTGHPIRHDDLNSRCPTLVFAHETRQSLGINVQIFLLADDDGEGFHY